MTANEEREVRAAGMIETANRLMDELYDAEEEARASGTAKCQWEAEQADNALGRFLDECEEGGITLRWDAEHQTYTAGLANRPRPCYYH